MHECAAFAARRRSRRLHLRIDNHASRPSPRPRVGDAAYSLAIGVLLSSHQRASQFRLERSAVPLRPRHRCAAGASDRCSHRATGPARALPPWKDLAHNPRPSVSAIRQLRVVVAVDHGRAGPAKLDMSLVRGMDRDSRRQSITRGDGKTLPTRGADAFYLTRGRFAVEVAHRSQAEPRGHAWRITNASPETAAQASRSSIPAAGRNRRRSRPRTRRQSRPPLRRPVGPDLCKDPSMS